MKKISKVIDILRIKFSDAIASTIATWKFIIIYTSCMILWIVLHKYQILTIDSGDFIRYNLFLSWAAGIQASIVLMASNRQVEKDRKSMLEGLEIDQETLKLAAILQANDEKNINKINKMSSRISQMIKKIESLEEIISDMADEEEGILNEKQEIEKGK